jgi:hypothetical protein
LRLEVEGELLRFYRLDTGDKLLIPTELAEKAEQEYQRAEAERERADEAEMKAAILTQRLRELGIEPDNL